MLDHLFKPLNTGHQPLNSNSDMFISAGFVILLCSGFVICMYSRFGKKKGKKQKEKQKSIKIYCLPKEELKKERETIPSQNNPQ